MVTFWLPPISRALATLYPLDYRLFGVSPMHFIQERAQRFPSSPCLCVLLSHKSDWSPVKSLENSNKDHHTGFKVNRPGKWYLRWLVSVLSPFHRIWKACSRHLHGSEFQDCQQSSNAMISSVDKQRGWIFNWTATYLFNSYQSGKY